MPSFNAQKVSYRARSANTVMIMIGDQDIGFAQTMSLTFDFGSEQLYGIGTQMPQEVQQLRVSPTITLDSFALTANGIALLGYTANLSTILAGNNFTITVLDKDKTTVLFTYKGCTASNFNENIPTNRPIMDAITFMCLDVVNSAGDSVLNSGNAYQVPSAAASAADKLNPPT